MSMFNPWKAFQALVARPPLQVGKVVSVSGGVTHVMLPGGQTVTVRGLAGVGQSVFLRDGVIEGEAPNLPVVNVEI